MDSANDRGSRILATAILATTFTLATLQWSARSGRLAQDITYDDVGYFLDGEERLTVLYDRGLAALVGDLALSPPHSPIQTALAAASFAILGRRDWAPYAANGLVLAAFLALVVFTLRGARLRWVLAGLLATLAVPLSFLCVHEFRPDFANALLTAAFCLTSVRLLLQHEAPSTRQAIVPGLLLGGALLAKPSFLPHTAGMAGLALGFGVLRFRVLKGLGSWPAGSIRRALGGALGGAAAVALPYYVVAGGPAIAYFLRHTGSGADAEVWRLPGTLFDVLAYYTVSQGRGPGIMLGHFFWLFLGLTATGLAACFLRGERDQALEVAALTGFSLASLAIMIYGRVQSDFFGLTYQILLLLAALRATSALVTRPLRMVGLGGGLLFVAASLVWPAGYATFPRHGAALHGSSLNEAVLDIMEREASANGPLWEPSLLASFGGEVNGPAIRWLALQRGFPLISREPGIHGGTEGLDANLPRATFVVVGEPDAPGLWHWLPSAKEQQPLLEKLAANPDFQEIGRAGQESGYRVFKNRPAFDLARNRLELAVRTKGLSPVARASSEPKLPRLRWGVLPASTFLLPAGPGGKASLEATAVAFPGQEIVVLADGREVGRASFVDDEFHRLAFSFEVPPQGSLLEIRYKLASRFVDSGLQWGLVFRDLHLSLPGDLKPR